MNFTDASPWGPVLDELRQPDGACGPRVPESALECRQTETEQRVHRSFTSCTIALECRAGIPAALKLIFADRRACGLDRAKARKDRAPAAFLIGFLARDRPGDLREALEEALSRGARWRARIGASLTLLPSTALTLQDLR